MKLKKFTFINHKTGWHVKDVEFGSLALFVGASGVGKTLILKSISDIKGIANGRSMNGREWIIDFEEDGVNYTWSGRFKASKEIQESIFSDQYEFPIVEEKLVKEGEVVFSRDGDHLIYHDVQTVKLDTSKSAVELLKEETDVALVKRAFEKILWLDMEDSNTVRFRPDIFSDNESKMSLTEIKNLKHINPIERLFFIQKYEHGVFDQIKEDFISVFPSVEDIDFEIVRLFKESYTPILKIKEQNVAYWINLPDVSSGMCRTLSQIVTLKLSDKGDVIMIDEFENGLGINCIDLLAEKAMDVEDVQIIMTSHHPYIINSIPYQDWRIVSRNGSEVMVNTAADFKIGMHSKHDAFMQLIQTDAYRTGQS